MIHSPNPLHIGTLLVAAACTLHAPRSGQADPPSPARVRNPSPPATLDTVRVVSDRAPVRFGDRVTATVPRGRLFGVVGRAGDHVVIQVCLGTDVHRGLVHSRHVKFLGDKDFDLFTEVLELARAVNPKVDVAAYRARLAALAKRLAAAAAPGNTPREKARLLTAQLFDRERFALVDGMDRLDRVLDWKGGNCLALSLLYLAAADEMPAPFYLVAAPKHAFVRYDDGRVRFNVETTKRSIHATDDYLRLHLGAYQARQAGGIDLVSLPRPRALALFVRAAGVELAEKGDHAAACRRFARAIELCPSYATAYDNWGLSLAHLGRYAAACDKFARSIAINPRHAEAYNNWGLVLVDGGRHAEACEKYARAIRLDPRHAAAHSNWAVALVDMGRPTEALAKCAAAVAIDRRYANAHYNWGCALSDLGRHAEACAKFATAATLDPRQKKTFCNWGLALAALRRHADAAETFAKAVALDPRYAKAHANWGLALAHLGRHAAASERFARAIALSPRQPELLVCWASVLARLGQRREALEKLDRAVALDPKLEPQANALRGKLDEAAPPRPAPAPIAP